MTKDLRSKYLSTIKSNQETKIIGISWRGGGTHTRIKEKSISVEHFFEIMCGIENVVFVSLQYGESSSAIDYWSKQGLKVINDQAINPLKNMDDWLSQVDSCDAVISVANTTIHGAGGLNIPTLCLLSMNSDWRWFDDNNVDQSYWYPSVGIVRETKHDGWKSSITKAREWIQAGCRGLGRRHLRYNWSITQRFYVPEVKIDFSNLVYSTSLFHTYHCRNQSRFTWYFYCCCQLLPYW